MTWKLTEAKNKLSEVIRLALTNGPQRIERRGENVVLLSEERYLQLTGNKPSLVEFLMSGPDWSDLDLERNAEPTRGLSQ